MIVRHILTLVFFFSSVFLFSPTAQAQFDLGSLFGSTGLGGATDGNDFNLSGLPAIPSFGELTPGVGSMFNTLSLVPSPRNPEPGESFSVELTAPLEENNGAIITWYVNGVEHTEAKNQRKATFTASGLGETMKISVVIKRHDGSTIDTDLIIVPMYIDITMEALTTVPEFYKGRAVPSANTQARATAVITTGSQLNRENLSYRWELNGQVLANGSIRGLDSVVFKVPQNQASFLKVSVSNASGVIGERSYKFSPAEPQILFYEENPLYGNLGQAFKKTAHFFGNQISVRAEPYYIAPYLGKENYLVEWNVDGQIINNSTAVDPTLAVLGSSGTEGSAYISLRMADLQSLSLPVQGSFSLSFGL